MTFCVLLTVGDCNDAFGSMPYYDSGTGEYNAYTCVYGDGSFDGSECAAYSADLATASAADMYTAIQIFSSIADVLPSTYVLVLTMLSIIEEKFPEFTGKKGGDGASCIFAARLWVAVAFIYLLLLSCVSDQI